MPFVAEQAPLTSERLSFDLTEIPCRTTILITVDGQQHVLLRDADRCFQLAVSGADIMQPVRLRIDAVWSAEHLKHRLWALECLNTLCANGRLPDRLFPSEARSGRLRFVLQTLDGSLTNASHRRIAEVLIGKERVQADWADPGDHLRDRVRRAIRRGRLLMDGGYRGFLT